MAIIKKAIEYIESHIETNISVIDVCDNTHYSKWEFQRVFRAFTGDSVGGYLRARRLTLAAETLMNDSEKRILDVAIESNFGSQEAFARAFKTQFTVSPTEIRAHSNLYRKFKKPRLTEISLQHLNKHIVKEPLIIDFPARHFVGMTTQMKTHLSADSDFVTLAPQLWMQFNQRRKEISARIKGDSFGFAISQDGDMNEDYLKYMASVQVADSREIPRDMELLSLKPMTYALFENVGHEEVSRYTIDYIYGIWLQNSDYERAEGYDYEVFRPDFKIGDPLSVSTYCLPVRSKT